MHTKKHACLRALQGWPCTPRSTLACAHFKDAHAHKEVRLPARTSRMAIWSGMKSRAPLATLGFRRACNT